MVFNAPNLGLCPRLHSLGPFRAKDIPSCSERMCCLRAAGQRGTLKEVWGRPAAEAGRAGMPVGQPCAVRRTATAVSRYSTRSCAGACPSWALLAELVQDFRFWIAVRRTADSIFQPSSAHSRESACGGKATTAAHPACSPFGLPRSTSPGGGIEALQVFWVFDAARVLWDGYNTL